MKRYLRLIWLFVLLLLCNARPALSQQLNFSLVPVPAEIPPWGLVPCITQDKSGFMWFTSTINGVYRYDGYKITNYLNDPHNPNSLANNQTEIIYADSSGIIWIGTRFAGLDRLDPVTGKFTHYHRIEVLGGYLRVKVYFGLVPYRDFAALTVTHKNLNILSLIKMIVQP